MKQKNRDLENNFIDLKKLLESLDNRILEKDIEIGEKTKKIEEYKRGSGGNFEAAIVHFNAAEFYPKPVDRLKNVWETRKKVAQIIQHYNEIKKDFEYIFVVGHANTLDEEGDPASNIWDRRRKNWLWATRRAAKIASMLGDQVEKVDMNKVVIVSTGEFDLRFPDRPKSQDNAWVQIIFGKHWKLPQKKPADQ